MTIAEQIADLHAAHPEWTGLKMAEVLGVDPASVRSAVQRSHILLPSEAMRRLRERQATYPRKFKKIGYAGKEHPSSSEWGR